MVDSVRFAFNQMNRELGAFSALPYLPLTLTYQNRLRLALNEHCQSKLALALFYQVLFERSLPSIRFKIR